MDFSLDRTRNVGPLTEMEDIPRPCSDAPPCLIRNLELALDDDFHLVIGVRIDQWLPFFETVQTARDGFLGVELLARENITQEYVARGEKG